MMPKTETNKQIQRKYNVLLILFLLDCFSGTVYCLQEST
eukprot:bmy_11881T0